MISWLPLVLQGGRVCQQAQHAPERQEPWSSSDSLPGSCQATSSLHAHKQHSRSPEKLPAERGMCCWFFVPGPFSPNLWLTFPTRHGCAHLQSHHIAPQDGDSSRLRSFCSCTILVTLMGRLSTKRRGHYIWEHLPMHSSLPVHSKQSDPHPTAPEDSKSNSCYNS